MSTLAALGDSFSCGEGVGVRVPISRAWPALLADAVGLDLHLLAAPGARLLDVRDRQLPQVAGAHLATVFAGLNDVCRRGFDPTVFAEDLESVVEALRWRAEVMLVVRLHDPTQHLWLPRRVKGVIRQRLAAVNRAVDQVAASSPGVRVLDVAELPALRHRCAWAADRVHPSAYGHAALAAATAEVLNMPDDGAAMVVPTIRATAAQHARWLVRHGAPYVVRHARTFATPVAEGLRRAR